MKLSVIVPVFNEAARVKNVAKIARYLSSQAFLTELIVVDDGSSDDTLSILHELQSKHAFSVISYQPNRGKGHAIRAGMLAASGDWRLFMDVDLSVPLTAITELMSVLPSHRVDVVVGTRKVKQAQVLVAQHPLRERMGAVFTALSRWWLQVPTSDFTCGFKAFSATAAKRIFSQAQLDRWGFDAEILFLVTRFELRWLEFPVQWKNDPRTKVQFPRDALISLWELWRIRQHQWQGHYT